MSFLTHALNVLSLAAIAGAVLLVLQYIYCLFFGPLNAIPGPLYTRFTHLVYKYNAIKSRRVDYIHSLHQKYGKVVRISPNEVSISDLPAVQEIHRVSTPFLKSAWYQELTARQPVNMFSCSDPHFHRTRRSLLAQPLSENALKKLEPAVNINIQKTIDGIASEYSQNGATDIFKWFTYMATDIIGELTFAESFRMLDHITPNQYYYDLKAIGVLGQYRIEFGILTYLFGILRIQPFANALAIVLRTRDYATKSVARYEKHVEENPDNPKPTLFTKLFTKEADGALSRTDIVREGVTYIAAGSDTTATTVTYLVDTLCRQPAIRDKLLAELATIPEDFSWTDLRHLPYLNNVIQEALRLFSAAPGSLKRDVPPTGATLAGYQFPAGSIVSTQCYTLHRDPAIWTDPETFNPDRWLNPTPEMNHAFMAFGAGTRICIGMHLARDEMRYAIAKFFRAFPRAKALESEEGMHQDGYFLMAPRAGKCMVDLGVKAKA